MILAGAATCATAVGGRHEGGLRRVVGGAHAAGSHPSCLASATKVGGVSSSGLVESGRPSASRASCTSTRVSGSAPGADGARQRVHDLLAALSERGAHQGLEHGGVVEGQRSRALERDERRIDPRLRGEDGARHRALRFELAGELHQHRHGRVGLGARHREQPLGELALQHHRPALQAGHRGDGAHEQRDRDVVGEVGHQRGRRRVEAGEPVAQGVDQVDAQVVAPRGELVEPLGEAMVDLEGVHVARLLDEPPGEQAVGGADLEHDVVGLHVGHGEDGVERAAVDQVVLAVAPPGGRARVAHDGRAPGRAAMPKARRALAVVTAATCSALQPRSSARNCAVRAT